MFGLSIRTLLLGLFALMIGLVIGLSWFALDKIAAVNGSTIEIATNWLPSVSTVRRLAYDLSQFRIAEARHILTTDDAGMAAVERGMEKNLADIDKSRRAYEALISSPEERAGYDAFARQWDEYMRVHAALLKLSHAN